jgi:hypothetical protein
LLDGKLVGIFTATPTTFSKDWYEQIPYEAIEQVEETYQEPYDDTESYTEQVPYTENQTTQVPCGDTTCPQTTPVTVYRTETKTRTVTRYRPATRWVAQQVTRYREEPRVFTYQGTRRTGRYLAAVRLPFEGSLQGFVPVLTNGFDAEGIDHDASFAPAGVSPSRANLLTLDGFVAQEAVRFADHLREQLAAEYRKRYCTASSYTPDAAAACAYLDPKQVPAPVHAALQAALGPDEPFVVGILGR